MNRNPEQFYIEWKANLEEYLKGYIFDAQNRKRRTRSSYLMLQKYVNKLLTGNLSDDEKIIILPGIRGVGKTTLLAQLFFFEQFKPENHLSNDSSASLDERFYVSADRLLSEGISLKDFVSYLENNVWGNLIKNDKKILLLIDEIQYDQQWDLFLKLMFDKTKGNNNILVVVTGSSAVFLNQKNKDLIRRSRTERVLPTKFLEYLTLHKGIFPKKDLSSNLRKAVFFSNDAKEVFHNLKKLQADIVNKLSSIEKLQEVKKDYFLRGSFPFSAESINQTQSLENIKNMVLTNIVQRDLILSFDSETLVKIPNTLFLLANSDTISTGKLSSTLNVHSNTINKILSSLVDAEILYEIHPYGQPYKQIKKSGKYLFISPNIRAGLLDGILSEGIKGKLLEDYMALIFSKELYGLADVYYDYGQGGADFIVRFRDSTEIVFEVGFSKDGTKQVHKTLDKTSGRAKYGIVIGSDNLEIVDERIVKIPLDYFLLM